MPDFILIQKMPSGPDRKCRGCRTDGDTEYCIHWFKNASFENGDVLKGATWKVNIDRSLPTLLYLIDGSKLILSLSLNDLKKPEWLQ